MEQKKYYPIGEVARMLNLSSSLIRFWESQFEALKPRKSPSGFRLFSHGDIEILKTLKHLLKEKKYTIEGAKKYLDEQRHKEPTREDIIQKLLELRAFLLSLGEDIGKQ